MTNRKIHTHYVALALAFAFLSSLSVEAESGLEGKSRELTVGDGKIINVGDVPIVDYQKGGLSKNIAAPSNLVTALSPDRKVLVRGSYDGSLYVIDVGTLQELTKIDFGEDNEFRQVLFSPDGRFVAISSGDYKVRILTATGWKRVKELEFPDRDISPQAKGEPPSKLEKKTRQGRIGTVAFSADGRLLAVGVDDRVIHLVETSTWNERWSFPVDADLKIALFTRDGPYLVVVVSGGAVVIETASGREARRYIADAGAVDIALSPDGRQLMVLAAQYMRVYELHTGRQVYREELEPSKDVTTYLPGFTPDGKYLIVGGSFEDGPVYVYDSAKWTLLARKKSLPNGHYGIAINGDSTVMAVKNGAESVRIFSIPAMTELLWVEGTAIIMNVDFTTDGKGLIIGESNRIRLHDISKYLPASKAAGKQR